MNSQIKKFLADKLGETFTPESKEEFKEGFLSVPDEEIKQYLLEQYGLSVPPVAVLRGWGIKVAIRHYRFCRGLGLSRVKILRENNIPGDAWKARGGMTEAEVILPSGEKFYAKVRCQKQDNYNKHTGAYLALEKILF